VELGQHLFSLCGAEGTEIAKPINNMKIAGKLFLIYFTKIYDFAIIHQVNPVCITCGISKMLDIQIAT